VNGLRSTVLLWNCASVLEKKKITYFLSKVVNYGARILDLDLPLFYSVRVISN